MADPSPSADDLCARARALVPAIRSRADAVEGARRMSDETIGELRAAGLFRVLQPNRFGGYESDLDTYARVVLALGRGCGSTAWVYSVVAMHAWHLGMFPGEAQDDVWRDDPDALLSSAYAPGGIATVDGDGYRLQGHWGFASACDTTSWIIVGGRVTPAGDAPPEQVFFLLPKRDYAIDDNWHVLGLCGTGSKNVVVTDVFVPRHRVLSVRDCLTGRPPGAAVNDHPIFRVPFFAAVGTCLCMPAVATAQAALEDYVDATRARVTRGAALGGGKQMAELPTIQLRVAEATAMIDAARTIVLRDLADTQATVAAGSALTPEQRLRNRLDHAFAARLAQQAVDRLFESGGGQVLFRSSSFQRAWRDVHASVKHISLNWDAVGTLYGKFALGIPLDGAQF
jgi:alkylation response protein AidB-like acyl-CoA dehydrogenase